MTKHPHDPTRLPDDLPVPEDDGACRHLPGLRIPSVRLFGTDGQWHDLAETSTGRWVVLFCYPRTGRPGEEPPGGTAAWNATPGARGCTPQCMAYAQAHDELEQLGVSVFGVSTQETAEQAEAAQRLGLTYALLSDADLALTRALELPTFTVSGKRLLRRHTLVLRNRSVRHVRYPVFPPDRDASETLDWIRQADPGR